MKLIQGNWYEGENPYGRWLFKFDKLEGKKYWNTKACTPHDNYITYDEGYLGILVNTIKPANMEEVYKFFPEEKQEEFKKYVLKENNMNKEIIGYKLIKPEYEEAAVKIGKIENCGWNTDLEFKKGLPYDCKAVDFLKKAGVLDLWFKPVYKSTEKTVSVGGKFDVVIKDGKIWHKSDDITQFVELLIKNNNIVNTSASYGKFSATISDIIFSKTGCQNVETKLSDWKQVYETYKSLQ